MCICQHDPLSEKDEKGEFTCLSYIKLKNNQSSSAIHGSIHPRRIPKDLISEGNILSGYSRTRLRKGYKRKLPNTLDEFAMFGSELLQPGPASPTSESNQPRLYPCISLLLISDFCRMTAESDSPQVYLASDSTRPILETVSFTAGDLKCRGFTAWTKEKQYTVPGSWDQKIKLNGHFFRSHNTSRLSRWYAAVSLCVR